ncbi:MAG: V-type ATP synthase subunit D [Candidatus Thermoplasmatota archaeon]|nr:V-type ATP synthase subunit D [Candidatus Thermoplasmatota archaeon]
MAYEGKPTRSELIEIKRKIKLSQTGHKLLKMKRDGLIMEFFLILSKARDIRSILTEEYREARRRLTIAEGVEGTITIKAAAFAPKDKPYVHIRPKNVMGVVVPQVESRSVKKKITERGYGIIGSRSAIDDAVTAYENLVEDIVVAAEIETTIRKLLVDIEKTKRRVNALEFKVIPELTEAAAFITFRLEEMERENTFRLKMIKMKGEKAAAAEAAKAAAV